MIDSRRKQTVRNLVIFAIVSVSIGWVGLWLNRMMVNAAPGQNLGMLLWLIVPALTGLLLRALAGDGWSDAGLRPALKKNLGWYGFALLVYPACVTLIVGLGYAVGAVSLTGLSSLGLRSFVGLIGAAVVTGFIKNIFEEFAWRGYLTPRLDSLGWGVGASSVLVGVIWGAWHVPYWVGFLALADFKAYTGLNLAAFVPLALVAFIPAAFAFGELRRVTGSVWPTVVMHTVGNAVILTVLLNRLIEFKSSLTFALFTPGMEGLLIMVLWALIGVSIYRRRTRALSHKRMATRSGPSFTPPRAGTRSDPGRPANSRSRSTAWQPRSDAGCRG
jgi:membrane protease YdiL (CAAX protease family)